MVLVAAVVLVGKWPLRHVGFDHLWCVECQLAAGLTPQRGAYRSAWRNRAQACRSHAG
jgi:hypothetical protein